jgi:hypothetical protein
MRFLFLSFPPRLEPLWPSGPYSAASKRHQRRHLQGTAEFLAWMRPLLAAGRKDQRNKGKREMDIIVIGIGIFFFVLSFAYIKACDNL